MNCASLFPLVPLVFLIKQNLISRGVCLQNVKLPMSTWFSSDDWLIDFKILLITFKILNFLAPTYLSSLISLTLPSKYNLRNSSDNLILSYPRFKPKATLGDRSFTCAAPKLWNALPFDIRSASSVSIFKAKLKNYLFRHVLLS